MATDEEPAGNDIEKAEPSEKPARKPGKDTLLLEEKDKQIADLKVRAKDAEDGEDAAQAETNAAWKWTATKATIAAAAGWGSFVALVLVIFGMTQLDLKLPGGIGMSMSKTADVKSSHGNETEEVLDAGEPE